MAVFPLLLPIRGVLSVLPDFPIGKREMETRADYYTETGKYRGGFPMYDDEFQLYECTTFNSVSSNSSATTTTTATDGNATTTDGAEEGNATVCMAWTANEVGSDVYDVGRCSCQSLANDAEYYCEAWTCSQLGVESTRCTCKSEDADSGQFCSSWSCVETDADGTQEFGEYQCVNASNSSPAFCEAWTGVIEGSGEMEVSACECVEQWDGVGVCSYWECKERGLDKCSTTNKGWCNIGVSVGVGGFFGSLGAMLVALSIIFPVKKKDLDWIVLVPAGLFWMSVWSAGVVVWGGQDGAMYAGIWWGAIIALALLYRCFVEYRHHHVTQSRNKLDAPIPN